MASVAPALASRILIDLKRDPALVDLHNDESYAEHLALTLLDEGDEETRIGIVVELLLASISGEAAANRRQEFEALAYAWLSAACDLATIAASRAVAESAARRAAAAAAAAEAAARAPSEEEAHVALTLALVATQAAGDEDDLEVETGGVLPPPRKGVAGAVAPLPPPPRDVRLGTLSALTIDSELGDAVGGSEAQAAAAAARRGMGRRSRRRAAAASSSEDEAVGNAPQVQEQQQRRSGRVVVAADPMAMPIDNRAYEAALGEARREATKRAGLEAAEREREKASAAAAARELARNASLLAKRTAVVAARSLAMERG